MSKETDKFNNNNTVDIDFTNNNIYDTLDFEDPFKDTFFNESTYTDFSITDNTYLEEGYYSTIDFNTTEPSTRDIGSEEKMSLSFIGKQKLCVYLVCDSVKELQGNKELLKNTILYESPNTAIASVKRQNLFKGGELACCVLDITHCLDLLDLHDIARLSQFYKEKMPRGIRRGSISDSELLQLYIKQNNLKVLRYLHEVRDSKGKPRLLHSNSDIREMFIKYRVVDTSCISDIVLTKCKSS